jgi:hypothetical protein
MGKKGGEVVPPAPHWCVPRACVCAITTHYYYCSTLVRCTVAVPTKIQEAV